MLILLRPLYLFRGNSHLCWYHSFVLCLLSTILLKLLSSYSLHSSSDVSTVSPECVEAAVEKVTRMSSVSPRSPEPVIESSEKWWRKKSDSVQKRLYTHFLSLPIREDYFRRQFSSFRSQALRNNYAGVDAFFFQLPTRLHLTICMLNLDTEDKVAECKRVIEGLQVRCINECFQIMRVQCFHPIYECVLDDILGMG